MGGKEISAYVVKTIRRVDGSYQNNRKMTVSPRIEPMILFFVEMFCGFGIFALSLHTITDLRYGREKQDTTGVE
jgi:hypothetical protein